MSVAVVAVRLAVAKRPRRSSSSQGPVGYDTLPAMKVLVLYRPNSEHARLVEEFIRDYKRHHEESQVEVLNIDTREGSAIATLYDIVQYPAILALQIDGGIQKVWQGPDLPRLDDVASYTHG
jgi:hypothetical protein